MDFFTQTDVFQVVISWVLNVKEAIHVKLEKTIVKQKVS